MWEFTHEETIDAPLNIVFNLISDLPNYQNWNPFLIQANGKVAVGEVVSGKSVLGKFTTSYRHKIFESTPNKSLCWRDFGFPSLLVCGQRSRYIETQNGKTLFKCHLKLSGSFSGLINIIFGKGLRQGIIAEAKALKIEATNIAQK